MRIIKTLPLMFIFFLISTVSHAAEKGAVFTSKNDANGPRIILNEKRVGFKGDTAKLTADKDAQKQLVSFVQSHASFATVKVSAPSYALAANRAAALASALVDGGVAPAKVGLEAEINKTAEVSIALAKPKSKAVVGYGAPVESLKAGIMSKLKKARPDLSFVDVASTEFPGLYEVQMGQGRVLYSNATGDNFVLGEIFKVETDGITNLTEAKKSIARAEVIGKLNPKELISYAPKGDIKSEIYVFTDVDCGYCRLLHKEIADLNNLGIKVSYLAYPRAGMNTPNSREMASAWCAKDPQEAMNILKAGGEIPSATCDDPVNSQFMLGQELGVNGTPAMFLRDGTMIPGYRKANDLAKMIGVQ